MKSSINQQFSLKERLWYSLYRAAIRMKAGRIKESVPKNLVADYSFFFMLDGRGGNAKRVGELNQIDYPVNTGKASFLLRRNSSDMHVFVQIMFEKEYERVIQLLQQHNVQPKVMIDAGCNIGLTTVYFKSWFPDAAVICIEPADETAEMLRKNIALNGLSNVKVEKKGLWSRTCFLKERKFRDGKAWSFSLEESDTNEGKGISAIDVRELMKSHGVDRIDFFKIDVEGAEKNIFLDDPAVTGWLTKVKVIAIEIHDEFDCREGIENLLRSANFELHHSGELTIGINKSY